MIHQRNLAKIYPFLGYFCSFFSLFFAVIFLWSGCVKPPQESVELVDTDSIRTQEKTVSVIVDRENVRIFPNGEIIQQVVQNQPVTIIAPQGNWMRCQINDTLDGFIWAPSLGY